MNGIKIKVVVNGNPDSDSSSRSSSLENKVIGKKRLILLKLTKKKNLQFLL